MGESNEPLTLPSIDSVVADMKKSIPKGRLPRSMAENYTDLLYTMRLMTDSIIPNDHSVISDATKLLRKLERKKYHEAAELLYETIGDYRGRFPIDSSSSTGKKGQLVDYLVY